MQLWTALFLGLLGGLHCVGMCGPLMLALPTPGGTPPLRFALGRVVYQLGRVATYTALGALAGLAGRTFALAGVQQWVSLSLGTLLLLGLLLSPKWLELPWLSRRLGFLQTSMARLLRQRTLPALAGLGALNGLLPCGLVYAAAAAAATQAHAWSGAAYMLVFGLGTVPMMLGMSLSGNAIPARFRLRLRRLVPLGLGIVGGLLVLRGLSLGIPYLSPDLSAGTAACCHGPTPTP